MRRISGLHLRWGVAGQIEVFVSADNGWSFDCRPAPLEPLCDGSQSEFPDRESATRAAWDHKRHHSLRPVA